MKIIYGKLVKAMTLLTVGFLVITASSCGSSSSSSSSSSDSSSAAVGGELNVSASITPGTLSISWAEINGSPISPANGVVIDVELEDATETTESKVIASGITNVNDEFNYTYRTNSNSTPYWELATYSEIELEVCVATSNASAASTDSNSSDSTDSNSSDSTDSNSSDSTDSNSTDSSNCKEFNTSMPALSAAVTSKVDNTEATGEMFGSSVSIATGGAYAVGVPGHTYADGAVIRGNAGKVVVYLGENNVFDVIPSANIENEKFGEVVALSGNGKLLVVGVPANQDDDSNEQNRSSYPYFNSGAVYVYDIKATIIPGKAVQHATKGYLKSTTNISAKDKFGASVSVDFNGSVVAIGAPGEGSTDASTVDDAKPGSGAVFVFYGTDLGTSKVLKATKVVSADDGFGTSVSLSSNDGKTLAVGMPGDDSNKPDGTGTDATDSGAVYVFSGTDYGTAAYVTSKTAGALFGTSVSLSDDGSIMAVGAPGSDTVAGAVHVFTVQNGNWTEINNSITLDGAAANTQFGRTVKLSSNGKYLAVGTAASAAAATDLNNSEAVHIYKTEDSGATWTKVSSVSTDPKAGDDFGASFDFEGDNKLIVGVPGADKNTTVTDSGAVYIY